ncbi:recombinase family protein [Streptomyces sp. NPDC050428]|uniref:recombinase family protein n=1 Tax=Streptomyces sp. NPDC050428 TaxID=3155757 RepID=UPI003435D9B6
MSIHAAGYGRQSAARANKSEASPTTQRVANKGEADRRKAAGADVHWVGHYEDIGISAYTGKERPGYERLLKDCRAGRVNMIIVYYISRLSRMEPLDAIPVVTELLNLGVTIVSVTEGEFRKGNLMDLIHLIMRLDAAHNESKNRSAAVYGAKQQAKEAGGYIGGTAPYGRNLTPETRRSSDGRPIVVQTLTTRADEADVIREVWGLIKYHKENPRPAVPGEGRVVPGSIGWITAKLNRDGVPTRGASKGKARKDSGWHPNTLTRILRDPTLAGYRTEAVYKLRDDGTRTNTVSEYRIVRDDHGEPVSAWEPILDTADWWQLQEWLQRRVVRKWSSISRNLLTSIETLYCECGRAMKSSVATKASGRQSTYRCSRPTGMEPDGQHTGTVAVSQELVDDYVARRIFTIIGAAEGDHEASEILREAHKRLGETIEAPETAQERAALVADRADAARALETLYDMQPSYMSNEIGRKRFAKSVSDQEARMAAAEERIAALAAMDAPALPIAEWLERDSDTEDGEGGGDSIGPGTWWAKADLSARRNLVKLFIERVVVRKAETRERAVRGKAWRGDRVVITWATESLADEERDQVA